MARIVVEVCAGTFCTMMGSMDIMSAIESLKELSQINESCELEVLPRPCFGNCQAGQLAPVVVMNGQPIFKADMETIMSMIMTLASECNQT